MFHSIEKRLNSKKVISEKFRKDCVPPNLEMTVFHKVKNDRVPPNSEKFRNDCVPQNLKSGCFTKLKKV